VLVRVRIGFDASKDVIVHREKIFELIRSEQRPARSA
jgi:sRNA-binding carbon storage regulator CsrA